MSKPEAPIDITDRVAAQLLLSDDFLKEGDFIVNGEYKEWTLEISAATQDQLQSPGKSSKESKNVIAFKGKKKRLPLNKTNTKKLRALFGNKVADWIGQRVVVFWTLTEPDSDPNKAPKAIRNPQDPTSPGGIRLKKASK
jgi:hypothetical protein